MAALEPPLEVAIDIGPGARDGDGAAGREHRGDQR
jgi:hypothetical protein